jgi:hypothetical protein
MAFASRFSRSRRASANVQERQRALSLSAVNTHGKNKLGALVSPQDAHVFGPTDCWLKTAPFRQAPRLEARDNAEFVFIGFFAKITR